MAVPESAGNFFRRFESHVKIYGKGRPIMSRIVRCGLTQTHHDVDGNEPVEKRKKSAIEKHLKLIDEAAQKEVKKYSVPGVVLRAVFLRRANHQVVRRPEPVPMVPPPSSCRK